MMLLSSGFEEYTFTIGIILSFIGIIAFSVKSRRNISSALKRSGLNARYLAIAVLIVASFAVFELSTVKATQQLFFDDAIYQGMALTLLHTGQAWMCDYGTSTQCFIGEIFHEPIGTSFNLALGYALFGASRATAFGIELFMACLAVLFTFLVALLMFKDIKTALFAELIMAMAPVLLVWAMPTTSDIPALAYSIMALFFMLIFIRERTVYTFAAFLASFAFLTYMKVDMFLFVIVLIAMFILLDSDRLTRSIKDIYCLARDNIYNTKTLLVLLFFVIAIAPSFIFSYNELQHGNYGAQGTPLQSTCAPNKSTTVNSSFSMINFKYNVCGNVLFWFDYYQNQYIMQPVLFSVLAILGVALMIVGKRKKLLLSLFVWFATFFLLYTLFYGGAVTFGVDWRFVLSMIAPVSIAAGFACSELIRIFGDVSKKKLANKFIGYFVFILLIILIAFSIYVMVPLLSISPSSIPQAQDARFYENFVYNDSNAIPNNCITYTYDPGLFQMNNRTALQMSYIYNSTMFNTLRSQNSCLVVDWGYWCYTPNNLCDELRTEFTLQPIANSLFVPYNRNYAFYYVTKK